VITGIGTSIMAPAISQSTREHNVKVCDG
jgi:hypothetical protein